MVRDKERIRTWKIVFQRAHDIEHQFPKFWEDVQNAAAAITEKRKGSQGKEGYKGQQQYKGGYKGKEKGGESVGYKGKNAYRVDYKGGNRGQDKAWAKGKDPNPQNPFVASAQANQQGWGGADPPV